MKDSLVCKTCCNRVVWVDKKYLPDAICKPGRMIWGAYQSYQDSNLDLVTVSKLVTIWQDNRIVILDSTNSNPRNVVHTDRRFGHKVI